MIGVNHNIEEFEYNSAKNEERKMITTLPKNAKPIEVAGSTLAFYEFEDEEYIYYYFDASMTAPPEPMVNAMAGLRLLDASNKKLIMINHRLPAGLFPKIEGYFDFEIGENSEGNSVVVFTYNSKTHEADLTQTHCDG